MNKILNFINNRSEREARVNLIDDSSLSLLDRTIRTKGVRSRIQVPLSEKREESFMLSRIKKLAKVYLSEKSVGTSEMSVCLSVCWSVQLRLEYDDERVTELPSWNS